MYKKTGIIGYSIYSNSIALMLRRKKEEDYESVLKIGKVGKSEESQADEADTSRFLQFLNFILYFPFPYKLK
jgi:hypothetical protein